MRTILIQFLKNNKQFLLFIILFLMFRGAIADWNLVPTGSMQPTIKEGDVILVNKLAYDIKLPFSDITLYHKSTPQRGDIIVFKSKAADNRLVKRVIGLPGETIAMQNNRLIINGSAAKYSMEKDTATDFTLNETFDEITHLMKISRTRQSSLQSFAPLTIPVGKYLVLGDNRDNSLDSRVYGLVPHSEVIGRSRHVLWSYNFDNYYIPRKGRILTNL